MAPTGDNSRILQIHPTRRCNLNCLHCYSASGPQQRDQLAPELFTDAIAQAAAQGYTVASFSGGEPILYKPLRQLLDQAHAVHLKTTVVSNGMLLDEKRLEQLVGAIDLLAISLDGMPESHDRMRNHPGAFATMTSRLPALRETGIPFGFIFTLTQQNFREFDWVVNFACEQGAQLLQVHPLEETGRAQQILSGKSPNANLAAYAYLKTRRSQQALANQTLNVQLDLMHQKVLQTYPERFYAQWDRTIRPKTLAELLSPLVLEADGTVVPLQYGFSRFYALGNIQTHSLETMFHRWLDHTYLPFLDVCQRVYEEMSLPKEFPIFDWYGKVADLAAQFEPVLAHSSR